MLFYMYNITLDQISEGHLPVHRVATCAAQQGQQLLESNSSLGRIESVGQPPLGTSAFVNVYPIRPSIPIDSASYSRAYMCPRVLQSKIRDPLLHNTQVVRYLRWGLGGSTRVGTGYEQRLLNLKSGAYTEEPLHNSLHPGRGSPNLQMYPI